MNGFEYKVSVIVPVYNAEEYLEDCIKSLLVQKKFDDYEVILVNDGSSDHSADICNEYAQKYNNIVAISTENRGVSHARNTGIDAARGKYIMFLDADDEFGKDTISNVYDYFEKAYDQVDVVTYPEVKYVDGKVQIKHFRYNFLKKTAIYDLKQNIYITQSRVNIAIKNLSEKIYFDEKLASAEDQEFLARLLTKTMKIGFVNKGEYKYKLRASSVSAAEGYVYYVANVIYDYYKKMFEQFGEMVPQYFQAMFLYDLNWKIRKDQLWPYHFEREEFGRFENTIIELLKKCDVDVIMNHPALDLFHKFYLLKLRGTKLDFVPMVDSIKVVCEQKVIYTEKKIWAIVCQMKSHEGKLKILAHLKSPVFAFVEKPELYAVVNESDIINIDLFKSTAGRYKTKIETNCFWGFYYETEIEKVSALRFEVSLEGVIYNPGYYFMPYASIGNGEISKTMYADKFSVTYENESFIVKEMSVQDKIASLNQSNYIAMKENSHAFDAMKYFDVFNRRNIWLYYDCRGVEKDNGYYQFIHDFDKNDGVIRYYIYNNDEVKEGLFEKKHKNYVVKFGSELHKKLFVNANMILTAFIEKNNVYPFTAEEMVFVNNWIHYEVVYLQHGILHASIPWKYTPESLQMDKIVVSSQFEKDNFEKKYNFRTQDILTVGMPRFEKMDRESKGQNRILFAPSWRNYLITPQVNNYWEPTVDKFRNSDYFKHINAFLQSKELHELLEKNDMYLDFKLHPIFVQAYKNLFQWDSNRICWADSIVANEDYKVFITDFSSYVFDFAYLQRDIIYFVPDYLQFKSGMNQYREMDLPFEDAFGEFTTDSKGAITILEKYLCKHGEINEKYKKRMQEFFLDFNNSSEKLYLELVK